MMKFFQVLVISLVIGTAVGQSNKESGRVKRADDTNANDAILQQHTQELAHLTAELQALKAQVGE